MVINDLDLKGITAFPYEADAPLLIDPDAVLPLSVGMQSLKAVGRWNAQGFKDTHRIENLKFNPGRSLNCLRQLGGKTPMEKLFGFFAFK